MCNRGLPIHRGIPQWGDSALVQERCQSNDSRSASQQSDESTDGARQGAEREWTRLCLCGAIYIGHWRCDADHRCSRQKLRHGLSHKAFEVLDSMCPRLVQQSNPDLDSRGLHFHVQQIADNRQTQGASSLVRVWNGWMPRDVRILLSLNFIDSLYFKFH